MDKKQKILELRERLDKTLAMPDLVNKESIKSLVKDQLLRSSSYREEGNIGNVVEKRTMEVSNFLEMLRSASKDQKAVKVHDTLHKEWKIKQDTDQLRVMYREGPHGTPFHTLLAEGYADGPIDVCLCVSWEATLYKKWWPQYTIPSFKITMSTCLQKVCIGEEISLIRVKVPWPVSDREALLHCFEIEYFKEDLIIILLNTISDTEHIDVNTHGFSGDGIPEAKETVRVDLVGGFVLQKVDPNRSYFRAIANMDIKLDFVPPTLINFISRQLIGNGHKLYQKAVGSVATSDEDYRQALQGPMYARIRDALDSCNKIKMTLVGSDEEKLGILSPEEHRDSDPSVTEIKPVTEIVEEETEQNLTGFSINQIIGPNEKNVSKEDSFISPEQNLSDTSTNVILPTDEHVNKGNTFISPEVENALRTLDQAIAALRGRGSSGSNQSQSDYFSINQEIPTSEAVINSCSISNKVAPNNCTNMETKPSNGEQVSSDIEDFRNKNTDSGYRREFMLSKERKVCDEGTVIMPPPPISESMRKVCDEDSLRANGFHRVGKAKSNSIQGNKKKQGLCCFSLFRN